VINSRKFIQFREQASEIAEKAGLKAKDFILTTGTRDISLKFSKFF